MTNAILKISASENLFGNLALYLYPYSKTARKSDNNNEKSSHLYLDFGMQIHSTKPTQNLQNHKSLFKVEPLWT